jgi:hypothetical protein
MQSEMFIESARGHASLCPPYLSRHCERSEAIQREHADLDCFVACAPRNDEAAHLELSSSANADDPVNAALSIDDYWMPRFRGA